MVLTDATENYLGRLHDKRLHLTLSKDGCHLAYVAGTRGILRRVLRLDYKVFMVMDSKSRPIFDGVGSFSFTPDGAHFGYSVRKGNRTVAILDDRPVGEHGLITDNPFALDRDGHKAAYLVGEGKEGLAVCVNGRELRRHKAIGAESLLFSPDGGRLAYSARDGEKWFVVVDGQAGPEFDAVGTVVFNGNAEHFAYPAWLGRNVLAVLDHCPSEPHRVDDTTRVDSVAFTPDGKRFGYTVLGFRGGGSTSGYAVVDGVKGPDYSNGAFSLVFSESGSVAYVACASRDWPHGHDRHFVVMNGQEIPVEAISIDSLALSPDGRHYAYLSGKGHDRFVVLDGCAQETFEWIGGLRSNGMLAPKKYGFEIPPVFSRDSKHLAYAAGKGTEVFAILDGQRGPGYDEIAQGAPSFGTEGFMQYLARRGRSLYRIQKSPK